MRIKPFLLVLLFLVAPVLAQHTSPLKLDSSDKKLVEGFNWAKRQALAYVFDNDPVGPWYEAALPGREAFCMRDVAHQSTGAHALGLADYTHNMLHKFAESVSDSKDWCGYWEIDRYNRPAPVDYKNDNEFWFNLPANFDVLDCCYRMYLWTGDMSYLNDPAFTNFYDRTTHDYVDRWDLSIDKVMKRQRWMNKRLPPDVDKKFTFYRGIPSYNETREDFVLGLDQLATQYAGFVAYARIEQLRGKLDVADEFLKKAADLKTLINSSWWDGKHFYGQLTKDNQFAGHSDSGLLYRDVAEDGPKAQAALNDFLDAIHDNPSSSVEGQSHHAEILYHYGQPEVAYQQMLDLARGDRERSEYPEVSYSVIGAIVTGTMGITVNPAPPTQAAEEGHFVDRVVKTLPSLGKIQWAQLDHLPIRANVITVRHEGNRKTILVNESGPALIWQATFEGSLPTLLVNGQPMDAKNEKEFLDRDTSWVRVPVGAGDSVTVEIPNSP